MSMRQWLATTVVVASLGIPSPGHGQSRAALEQSIRERAARDSGVVIGVTLRSSRGEVLAEVNGDSAFHAASTMKVPVMVAFFQAVEAGRIDPAAGILLVNRFASIVDGSQYALDPGADSDSAMYLRAGTRVRARELVERMITRSSNLATNAIIALVGAPVADSAARALGATHTKVLRGVEDQKAFDAGLSNATSSNDLAAMLGGLLAGRGANPAHTSEMLAILERQEFNDEIPAGLPPGTRVAHKTGSITAVLHDAAIVFPRDREPFILVVLTKGLRDENRARRLIADIARLSWTAAGGAR